MKSKILIIGLILISQIGISQKLNILDCLKLIDFKLRDFNKSDFSTPTDSIIDIKAGYYELSLSNTHIIDDIEQSTILCQASKFNNDDGTITLAISGYYGDEQCSNHPTYFYEISESKDNYIKIKNTNILPSLNWNDFLSESKSIKIIEKYLPEIKESYLDSSATIETILGEIYDIHYILPRKGTSIIATLTICDYIPTNEVNFNASDWEIIEKDYRTIEIIYNNKTKLFTKE